MRFPILTKHIGLTKKSPLVSTNLSDHLVSSLFAMGIIESSADGWPIFNQYHFDLPIANGPLLDMLNYQSDMEGRFHVGCSADFRPPSFSFTSYNGSIDNLEGVFTLAYERRLKFSVFHQNLWLRDDDNGPRDLMKLAHVYNDPANYIEEIRLRWDGWTGNMVQAPYEEQGVMQKDYHVPEKLELTFCDGFLISISPYTCMDERARIKNPGVLLRQIEQTIYHELRTASPHQSINVDELNELGVLAEKAIVDLADILQKTTDMRPDNAKILNAAKHFQIPTRGYVPYSDYAYCSQTFTTY
jgi:hypothetical protein